MAAALLPLRIRNPGVVRGAVVLVPDDGFDLLEGQFARVAVGITHGNAAGQTLAIYGAGIFS